MVVTIRKGATSMLHTGNNRTKILTLNKKTLTLKALNALINEDVIAIRVPGYIDANCCIEVTQKILNRGYEYYEHGEGILGRVGYPFSSIAQGKNSFDRYYKESTNHIHLIRDMFAPHLSPIDKLRLELEEQWPAGAILEQLHLDHKMFVGLFRIIEPNRDILPHQDILSWAVSNNKRAEKIKASFAVNAYLRIPEYGGELVLWNYGLTKKEYLEKTMFGHGINSSLLRTPSIVIKPKIGDLIIFNSTKLHSIRPSNSKRITMSCFIGYYGDNQSLTYWS